MKKNPQHRLTVEHLESRRLLTSLPAISFTSAVTELSGGFEATVLGGELTNLNRDSTGVIRQQELDFVVIREGNVVEFWLHEGEGEHTRAAQRRLAARPTLLAPGDLNHDGYEDFVVATNTGIEVFLNQGADIANERSWNGIAAAGTVRAIASSMTLGRIDNDGVLDLLITTAEHLEVFPGMGDGTFGTSIRYPIGQGNHAVVVEDINGDGHRDAIVGTQIEGTNTGKATVFLNDGDGILEIGQTINDAGPVRTISLADLNADQAADLIVGTWASRHLNDPGGENIHVWHGNGDGTFANQRADYETAGSPIDIAIDDMNADGLLDVIVGHDSTFHHPITNNGPGGVSVLLGVGDGELLEPVRLSTPGAHSVSAVNSQIASFQQTGNTIRYFEWDYGLTANGMNYSEPVDNLYTRRSAVTGDFNGDGILDAAETQTFQDNHPITIRLRDAQGSQTVTIVDVPRGFSTSELHTGDLNGDGWTDLAVTGRLSNRVRTASFLSNGDGTFSAPVLMSHNDFQPIDIVDIGGDGLEDWLGIQAGNLTFLKSNVDGSRQSLTLARNTNGDFRDAVIASRNEDGHANLLAVSSNGVHAITANNEGLYTETFVSASYHFHTFGDFDGDGRMDTAFGTFFEPQVRVVFGMENGQLGDPITVATREGVESLVTLAGQDQDAMLLVQSANVELLSMIEGSTPDTPNFEGVPISTGAPVGSAFSQQILGDATPDLVLVQGNNLFSSSPSTQILVAEAMPDGTFSPLRHVAVPLVEGQVLATVPTERGAEFMLTHRWGFASLELGPGIPGDFDVNGRIDNRDVDLLCAAYREQEATMLGQFDLDGDEDLDQEDIDIWIHDIAHSRRGDLNLDGKVDFQDFLQMSGNFGQQLPGDFLGPGGWERGDTDCDGEVSFADFLMMSANFGFGTI